MSQVQVDSAQIDALTAAVGNLQTVTTSLQADNAALVGLVQSVEQQLAAAIAAQQPLPVADLTNTLQTIQGVLATLTATDAADTAITSAQTATTAVATAPAAPPAVAPGSSTAAQPVIPVVDLNPNQGATVDPNTGMIQGVHPTVAEDGTITGTGTAPNAGDPTGVTGADETSPVPTSAPAPAPAAPNPQTMGNPPGPAPDLTTSNANLPVDGSAQTITDQNALDNASGNKAPPTGP